MDKNWKNRIRWYNVINTFDCESLIGFDCLMVFNATFNNISVISWRINWIWYEWHSSNNLIRSGVVIRFVLCYRDIDLRYIYTSEKYIIFYKLLKEQRFWLYTRMCYWGERENTLHVYLLDSRMNMLQRIIIYTGIYLNSLYTRK